MDWYSWLAKSNLDRSLVYNYSLLFSENELEADDAAHFDHEFLKSIGVAIAKHRLEILKLVKSERRRSSRPFAKLLAAMKSTKKHVSMYIRRIVHRNDSAIVVVPKTTYNSQRMAPLMKRKKRLVMVKQGRLMLTNGGRNASGPLLSSQCASPMICYGKGEDTIRWDFMFQDLKPT